MPRNLQSMQMPRTSTYLPRKSAYRPRSTILKPIKEQQGYAGVSQPLHIHPARVDAGLQGYAAISDCS